jgi:hypothetical protein
MIATFFGSIALNRRRLDDSGKWTKVTQRVVGSSPTRRTRAAMPNPRVDTPSSVDGDRGIPSARTTPIGSVP